MNAPDGFFERLSVLENASHQAFSEFVTKAIEVRTADDLIALAQHELQAVFPHGMLLAGLGHTQGDRIIVREVVAVNYPAEHVEKVRTQSMWAGPVLSKWLETREPQLFSIDVPSVSLPARWLAALRRHDLRNIAAHGVRDIHGPGASYFSFSRVAGCLDVMCRRRLEALVPHLHQALIRVAASRTTPSRRGSPEPVRLSHRELQVLQKVGEGKSNLEIANDLCRSVYTINNQMRSILEKLRVENRAQAVRRAIEEQVLPATVLDPLVRRPLQNG
jgi:transcriptional regulator EpsA